MRWPSWLAGAALVALAGCTPENGPLMRPGEDCMRCHGGAATGGRGEEEDERGPTWTIAGTVYATPGADPSSGVLDAHVLVTDASGFSFTMRTNQAGNFYSAEAVTFPLHVCVERQGASRCMEASVAGSSPAGSCNACHTVPAPPGVEVDGRVFAP